MKNNELELCNANAKSCRSNLKTRTEENKPI